MLATATAFVLLTQNPILTGKTVIKGSYLYLKIQDKAFGVEFSRPVSAVDSEVAEKLNISSNISEEELAKFKTYGINGVLGSDVFRKYDLEIDIIKNVFKIDKPSRLKDVDTLPIKQEGKFVCVLAGSMQFELDYLRFFGSIIDPRREEDAFWGNSSNEIAQLNSRAYAYIDNTESQKFGYSILTRECFRISLSCGEIYSWNRSSKFNSLFALRNLTSLPLTQIGEILYPATVPEDLKELGISKDSPLVKVNDLHIVEFNRQIESNYNSIFFKIVQREFKLDTLGFRVGDRIVELKNYFIDGQM